ncbi:HEPN domain-containing protein [Streptomyces ferrugineus]|uniref:HEPN domain-containing protein n=1 Tax=Streptomyces ferrugineus TaxID=1413221 RepID=A0A7M2SLS1_9ACTN|nr:HEPN domain-containing protein [Streptomyces ferrugineus]
MLEDAARARQREAKLLQEHNQLCGAVYLVGYVVECKLKTLLNKKGKSFPRSGSAGHDLRGLWDAAGLRSQDLSGHKKAFMDTWTTSLRYSAKLPDGSSAEELLRGAQELASYVTSRIRYARPHNRGGRR